jgi:hypothetical protein
LEYFLLIQNALDRVIQHGTVVGPVLNCATAKKTGQHPEDDAADEIDRLELAARTVAKNSRADSGSFADELQKLDELRRRHAADAGRINRDAWGRSLGRWLHAAMFGINTATAAVPDKDDEPVENSMYEKETDFGGQPAQAELEAAADNEDASEQGSADAHTWFACRGTAPLSTPVGVTGCVVTHELQVISKQDGRIVNAFPLSKALRAKKLLRYCTQDTANHPSDLAMAAAGSGTAS